MNATVIQSAAAPARSEDHRDITIVTPASADAFWLVNDLMETQLTSDAMDIMHVTIPPGGGPPPHLHRREDEMFYVVEGNFEFVLGDRKLSGGAGTALFLPRHVVHRFQNVGDRDGRLLVTAAPGGFVRFVASTGNVCLDRSIMPQVGRGTIEKLAEGCAKAGIELLPNWKATQPAPPRPAPREVWCIGLHIKLLLTSEETNGQFSMAEITAAPGDFVPPHTHETEDEYFYVVDGLFEFELPKGTLLAAPGTFIHIPRQMLHGFRNVGRAHGKLFDVHTPGGFEKFFIASGTACRDIKLGPPKTPPDMPRFLEICRRHGMEVAAPA